MQNIDVIVVGAGASGLMCAIEAGKRGRKVIVIEHSKKLGEKIRISGGGKCNFTNLEINPNAYISHNPHFMKSALKQYTQWDFISLISEHKIEYFEKDLGQLFCKNSAFDIIDMLRIECEKAGVEILMETEVYDIKKPEAGFILETSGGEFFAESFVVASGGLSIPKIGASGFGYDVADFFKIPVLETYPALVPLTFNKDTVALMSELAGISVDAVVSANGVQFREGLLFTHRGLSGPSILQISSYMNKGDDLSINLLPDINVFDYLKEQKIAVPKRNIDVMLKKHLPNRLVDMIMANLEVSCTLGDATHAILQEISDVIHNWKVCPNDTEGYRTAEVTRGGIDTDYISSKTMECNSVNGLYFIGECVDVTGWLGGYNFQWAWSSGYACGQHC